MKNVGRLNNHQCNQVNERPTPPKASGKHADIQLFIWDHKKNYGKLTPKDREYHKGNPSNMPEETLANAIKASIPKGIIG